MAPPPPPLVGWVRGWGRAPSPLRALAALAGRPHAFLRWGAAGPRDLARWSFAGSDPTEVLRQGSADGPGADRVWDRWARRWPVPVRRRGPRIPFAGGWFGLLAYELRSAVERTPPGRAPADGFPALWLGHYDAVLAWDGRTARAYVAGLGTDLSGARDAADRLVARLRAGRGAPDAPPGPPSGRAVPTLGPQAYRRRVARVVARIRAGDLFQANVSQRFEGRYDGRPLDLFRRMARTSPAPFLTYLDLGAGRCVLSASPERFLALRGSRAQTRPMKGTRPRGATPAEDRRLRAELAASVKDRAELAMIVDLARNDLGRSCRPGTVRVATARRLERYATVHQAVGVVTGRLSPGRTGVDLVRGAFPPGSVTGAPKVEALRLIDQVEREARGVYCGALGWLDAGGDLDLAVAIRTITVAGRSLAWRVGGGVTLLSDPDAEYRETLDKGRALARAVGGGVA